MCAHRFPRGLGVMGRNCGEDAAVLGRRHARPFGLADAGQRPVTIGVVPDLAEDRATAVVTEDGCQPVVEVTAEFDEMAGVGSDRLHPLQDV